ncbi:MAG: SDR family oxidoreductase [Baekduia sp.]
MRRPAQGQTGLILSSLLTGLRPSRPGGLPERPVALVAGGSRGLGLLVARELAERGCRVAICGRDRATLTIAQELLADDGPRRTSGRLRRRRCAIRSSTWVEAVEQDLGPVDVAIHVAGVIQVGPVEAMTHEHFGEAIGTMLWGPVNLALAVLPGMRQRRRGRIGVVSSIAGRVAVPHLVPYTAAKFGAAGFTDALRTELAGTGITATTVTPGLMRTGSHLRAEFTGDVPAEYAWFSSGMVPLVSIDAGRAAARITDGVLRGDATVVLTPLAQVAIRANGLAPGLTSLVARQAARLLPAAPSGLDETVDGTVARTRLDSRLVDTLTTLADRAARRTNELAR